MTPKTGREGKTMKDWTKENKKTLKQILAHTEMCAKHNTPETKTVCWMENGRLRYSWTRNPIGEKLQEVA